ncbi:MAG: MFS transporter [Deltaproteobacteria bacterium]|nr:MFS transporter [Deltaproteobacteria bacterium]
MSFATRALIILTSLNLLDYLDRYLVASLGSLVKGEFALSDRAFGFLGTAFFLVYLCSSPVFGFLGDRWGRLRLMAGGAVLWSLATSLTFWVGSYPTLVLARGAVGVGEASFGTLSPAYLADILPLGRRARALGWFYLAIPVGSALAYLAGGLMGSHWGWRPAFLLAGIPGLAMAALVWRLPGVSIPSASPAVGAPLKSSLSLMRIPTFRWVSLGYGMVTFALGGLAFWMPTYLQQFKGLSLAHANLLLFGSVAVAGALGTLSGGFLGDLFMSRTLNAPLWVSGLGIALGLPMAALTIFSPIPYLYMPALSLAIFLLFINQGVLTSVIVSVSGARRRAQAVALNIVVIHLVGDVPSPFLIGLISDFSNLKWGVSLTLIALAAGAVLIFKALPHFPKDLAKAGEL